MIKSYYFKNIGEFPNKNKTMKNNKFLFAFWIGCFVSRIEYEMKSDVLVSDVTKISLIVLSPLLYLK